MPRKLTKEQFIENSIKIHGDKYDYSKVEYIDNMTHVEIFCKKHNEYFPQTPNLHRRSGCPKCGEESRIKSQTKTKEDFIKDAISVHGDKYSYDDVDYKGNKEEVTIFCKVHNEYFNKRPDAHISQKQGCPKCALRSKSNDKELFLEEVEKVHGDTYGYDNVDFTDIRGKVNIFCNTHGYFPQFAHNHLAGMGCKQCHFEKAKYRPDICTKEGYVKQANGRSAIIYLIKCFDENESFYKIGKTFRGLKKRFSPCNLPYKYEVISIFKKDAGFIFDLEQKLHEKYKEYRYNVIQKFDGYSECYNLNLPIEEIKNL